jgi:hypothetical protein
VTTRISAHLVFFPLTANQLGEGAAGPRGAHRGS